MQKDQIKILIIEDDKFFGGSLVEALKRTGYNVTLTPNPAEARSLCEMQSFQLFIIDCMLPKVSGIDLATQFKASYPNTPVILMSGIYKDKAFSREALLKTKADLFLTKPIDIPEFLQTVSGFFSDIVEEERAPLPQLFANPKATSRQIRNAIDESEEVHGFELPFIYSLFLNAGLTGHMNIVEASGDLFGIAFYKGKIISVDNNDSKSYLGELLIEYGFITPEELAPFLEEKSSVRLGERLFQANAVSPHAIEFVMKEQLNVRLSKTVHDTSVEINFVKSDELENDIGIDLSTFVTMATGWMYQKISGSWLKNYYLPWLDAPIEKGPLWRETHPALHTPSVQLLPNFLHELTSTSNIQELLNKGLYEEEALYRALHLLAITRCISFGATQEKIDYRAQMQRLEKLDKDLKVKNHFEILNVSRKAKSSEIRRSYHELAKILHPDRLGSDAPAELSALNTNVFTAITNAHNILKDDQKREQYLKELEQGQAQQLLHAEALFEKGKELLRTGHISQALPVFNEASEIHRDNFEIKFYRIWAQLKALEGKEDSFKELGIIEQDIVAIAPEYRNHPIYHLIKGLLQKLKGRPDLAKNHIENAIKLDRDFLEARRELNMIKLKEKDKGQVDILRSDLKDVVGLLFKRK